MLLHRNFTNKINWLLDNLVPPLLRDQTWLWSVIFKTFFGSAAQQFLQFKHNNTFLDAKKYSDAYTNLGHAHIQRPTDLNQKSLEKIIASIKGESVLDAGCGRGYLVQQIAAKYSQKKIVGCDIYLSPVLESIATKNLKFVQGDNEQLPFADNSFDTVICTHTLEHVRHLDVAIAELRRVAKKRLICVFPRQREYPYTFDLHVNFFPYAFSVYRAFQNPAGKCELVDNDWFYTEETKKK
jgi:ubiquinone/menaquinone biosynthesis C-methylase UbiE